MTQPTFSATFATFGAYEKTYNFSVVVTDEYGNMGSSFVTVDWSLAIRFLLYVWIEKRMFSMDSSIFLYGYGKSSRFVGAIMSKWICEDCLRF